MMAAAGLEASGSAAHTQHTHLVPCCGGHQPHLDTLFMGVMAAPTNNPNAGAHPRCCWLFRWALLLRLPSKGPCRLDSTPPSTGLPTRQSLLLRKAPRCTAAYVYRCRSWCAAIWGWLETCPACVLLVLCCPWEGRLPGSPAAAECRKNSPAPVQLLGAAPGAAHPPGAVRRYTLAPGTFTPGPHQPGWCTGWTWRRLSP